MKYFPHLHLQISAIFVIPTHLLTNSCRLKGYFSHSLGMHPYLHTPSVTIGNLRQVFQLYCRFCL